MQMIESTDQLAQMAKRLSGEQYITVDTEFVREKTYWPQLCLVQVAGSHPDDAYIIDPLAEGIDLTPLFDLMRDPAILKVFHAARQDLEIFVQLMGDVPAPLFDTQIAAMVCGFGDQVGYETLARKLADATLDKTSRFTDWSRRPLSKRQLDYAIGDVTHLRVIYEALVAKLDETSRFEWVGAEFEELHKRETYITDPRETWQRIKTRTNNGKFLAVLRELAAWREQTAQQRNIPKNRIIKDDGLTEIAAHLPKSVEELENLRGVSQGMARGKFGPQIIEAIKVGLAVKKDDQPKIERSNKPKANGIGPLVELLKVLLKLKSEEYEVAPRLLANVAQLEEIAANDKAKVPALEGWRREIFGDDALALKRGKVALSAQGTSIKIVRTDQGAD